VQDFRKLKVWQKSYELTVEIYRVTRAFPKDELYSLTNQMRRAAISIPANIAEGCGRYTETELVRFLDIAMGSASELDCYLQLSRDLEYLSNDGYTSFESKIVEVKRMLTALILKIRRQTDH
jgi:four helix bundle protein